MRLKGYLDKASFEALNDEQKAFYESLEGTEVFVLKEGETEDVSGLKSALEKEKEKARTRQQALEALKGVDVNKYNELIKAEEDLNKQRGEIETQISGINSQWEAKLANSKTALTNRINDLMAVIESTLVDNELLKAAGEKILSPRIWLSAARGHVKLQEEKGADGKPVFKAIVVDDKGVTRLSPKSNDSSPMTIDELVDDLGTQDDFKPLYKAVQAAGSGAAGNRTGQQGHGGAIVLSREEAKDAQKYRTAKEQAATAGVELQIAQT